jgi:Tfp pilus assembly protein PilO
VLVVAGATVALVFGYLYVVEPLIQSHRTTQELIAARESLLARQERLIGRRVRYEQDLDRARAEIAQHRERLLPGDKAPIAASELQKLVKATAQDTGVEVRSERVLPTIERGGFTEVPIEVTLTGPIRAIAALLHQLEGAPVLLTLGDLKLRVVSVSAPRDLSATVALTGYIAGAAAPPSPPGTPRARTSEPPRSPGT